MHGFQFTKKQAWECVSVFINTQKPGNHRGNRLLTNFTHRSSGDFGGIVAVSEYDRPCFKGAYLASIINNVPLEMKVKIVII